jgi:hypothetical protein
MCIGLGSQKTMMLPVLYRRRSLHGYDGRAGARQRLAFSPAPLDHSNRAQASFALHSLSAKDVDAHTAYVLNINGVTGINFIADRNPSPKVGMQSSADGGRKKLTPQILEL